MGQLRKPKEQGFDKILYDLGHLAARIKETNTIVRGAGAGAGWRRIPGTDMGCLE